MKMTINKITIKNEEGESRTIVMCGDVVIEHEKKYSEVDITNFPSLKERLIRFKNKLIVMVDDHLRN